MPFASIILKALSGILLSLLTESFIKSLVVIILEKLVESSDNTLDNKILDEVKKALGK